jgi:site-specific DNA-methyltransferase (adenine-specific)/modification methylase
MALQLEFPVSKDNQRKTLIYLNLDVDKCVISRFNTRKNRNDADITTLAQRIERNGFEITRALWVYTENGQYEVFAGGNRFEAVSKTSERNRVPAILHEGFSDEEIARLETLDNENDEYHVVVSVVDVWEEYARLRDEERWTQEKIAKAKGTNQTQVSRRLKWNDELPGEIKEFMQQEKMTEGHLQEITALCNVAYFAPWLTTEELWITLARKVVKDKLPVSKLKKEIDKWKETIDRAEDFYNELPSKETKYIYEDGMAIPQQWDIRQDFVSRLAAKNPKTLAGVEAIISSITKSRIKIAKEYEVWLQEKQDEVEAERRKQEAEVQKEEYLRSRIIHADNMGSIADNSVDLIVADPPYNISDAAKVTKKHGEIIANDFIEWDNQDKISYCAFLKRMLSEFQRVLKDTGSFYIFLDKPLVTYVWDEIVNVGMKPKNIIVWHKTNPVPSTRKRNYVSAIEFIVFGVKTGEYTFNFTTNNEMHNWIESAICGGEERTEHPTQKPLAVIEPLIETSSNPGDVVLDPYAGSGTTGAAAYQLDRDFRLIESEESYIDLIYRRLRKCMTLEPS